MYETINLFAMELSTPSSSTRCFKRVKMNKKIQTRIQIKSRIHRIAVCYTRHLQFSHASTACKCTKQSYFVCHLIEFELRPLVPILRATLRSIHRAHTSHDIGRMCGWYGCMFVYLPADYNLKANTYMYVQIYTCACVHIYNMNM